MGERSPKPEQPSSDNMKTTPDAAPAIIVESSSVETNKRKADEEIQHEYVFLFGIVSPKTLFLGLI